MSTQVFAWKIHESFVSESVHYKQYHLSRHRRTDDCVHMMRPRLKLTCSITLMAAHLLLARDVYVSANQCMISPNACGYVNFSSNVTAVNNSAFQACSDLVSIYIPDSVSMIGEFALSYTPKLEWVSLPDSLRVISISAFERADALTHIALPNSITYIGVRAFSGCLALASIVIPSSMVEITMQAFYMCQGLVSVTIPDTILMIGSDSFGYTVNLTSVVIPDSVLILDTFAFYASDLSSVVISTSLSVISYMAFDQCKCSSNIYTRGATIVDCRVQPNRSITVSTTPWVSQSHSMSANQRIAGGTEGSGLADDSSAAPPQTSSTTVRPKSQTLSTRQTSPDCVAPFHPTSTEPPTWHGQTPHNSRNATPLACALSVVLLGGIVLLWLVRATIRRKRAAHNARDALKARRYGRFRQGSAESGEGWGDDDDALMAIDMTSHPQGGVESDMVGFMETQHNTTPLARCETLV